MVFKIKKILEIYFLLIEMINKDNKIETLEKEIETIRNEIKTHEENQVNIKYNKYFH